MPRRHAPSQWQPEAWNMGQERYNEVRKLYPAPVMAKIIKAASLEKIESDLEKREKLVQELPARIINLAVMSRNWIGLRKRPTPAQRKTALLTIEKAAKNLHQLLGTLDGDSSHDLRQSMMSDPFSHQLQCDIPASDPCILYRKFDALVEIVEKLGEWAHHAECATSSPKDGNKRADAKHWFADGLVTIWLAIGHPKPTITYRSDLTPPKTTGPLMEFANAVSNPLGLGPMEAAMRLAIESWKNGGL